MIELQLKLLGNDARNKAFFEALKKTVQKGKSVVADIGSGTGFLSFLASKLGAKECHLYEYSDLLEMSRDLAELNGIKNCRFIKKHSAKVKNPPKADIVISETLGNYALEENIIENLEDAKRFLAPAGVIIPGKIAQFVAPVVSPRIINEINPLNRVGFDLDFSPVQEVALNNMFVFKIGKNDLLQGANSIQKYDDINFDKKNSSTRSGTVSWKLEKDTEIFGFGIWWNCILVPSVTLSTSPFEPSTHWDQIFLPLSRSIKAKKSQKLEVTIISNTHYEVGIRLEWNALLSDEKGRVLEEIVMDTWRGA
ncbi:50S ribosomal protein L11 methyltransferase [Candidatus Peregrinibacteria bacterium]|nr:50S ribosomal protein L11 methyltransferase [Candidatus Peregrinibacteria bacterium]